jgi:DNA-directed RNA polymerase specialized sigma24 family protein
MFCLSCGDRAVCTEICARLERHLKEREGYQRELLTVPLELESRPGVTEAAGVSLADLQADSIPPWEALAQTLHVLPLDLLTPFLLYYYEGRSQSRIARERGLHRVTVHRWLAKATALIRAEARRQGLSLPEEREDG